MAKTVYVSGTIVTKEVGNKWFDHVHDGVNNDGHVAKINLAGSPTEISGRLPETHIRTQMLRAMGNTMYGLKIECAHDEEITISIGGSILYKHNGSGDVDLSDAIFYEYAGSSGLSVINATHDSWEYIADGGIVLDEFDELFGWDFLKIFLCYKTAVPVIICCHSASEISAKYGSDIYMRPIGYIFKEHDPSIDGSISSFADYGGTVPGTVKITDTGHGLSTGDNVRIMTTTNYDGNYSITKITNDEYYITHTWDGTETGIWEKLDGILYQFYTSGNESNFLKNINFFDDVFDADGTTVHEGGNFYFPLDYIFFGILGVYVDSDFHTLTETVKPYVRIINTISTPSAYGCDYVPIKNFNSTLNFTCDELDGTPPVTQRVALYCNGFRNIYREQ